MIVSGVVLQNFRSHISFHLKFDEKVTLIVGLNGSGKSSILEALHLFATGKSVRATQSQEMITLGQELARVKAKANADELEAIITRGYVNGRRTSTKLWSVNGVRRAQRAAVGQLKSILFRPEDMRLIEGSPGRRREFLDDPLCQLFPDYRSALAAYDQHLTRRNRLLSAVRDGEQPRSVLSYWTAGLLKHGETIQEYRRQFFAMLPFLAIDLPFSAEYKPSVMSEDRQKMYLEKEIASGHTLIGPPKDDFDVLLPLAWLPPGSRPADGQPLSVMTYGSRGQQRLAVLWLKLCEAAYIESISKEKPVLLLDDILSELDEQSRHHVVTLAHHYQTILTSIDEKETGQLYPDAPLIILKEGGVQPSVPSATNP